MRKQQVASEPEVNLVPMMDVLMSILTFFIIISMTLTGESILGIDLPKPENAQGKNVSSDGKNIPTFQIKLKLDGRVMHQDQVLTDAQLSDQIYRFLSQSPTGIVVLVADKELSYESVLSVLAALREIGGNRVSLSID